MRLAPIALALLLAAVAAPARAGLLFEVAGGISLPAGAANRSLSPGGAVDLGFGYGFSRYGLLLHYTYAGNSIGDGAVAVGDLEGLQAVHALALDGRAAVLDGNTLRIHLLVAPGLYYRNVSIDRVEGTTVTTFCDPVLLFCSPQQVPITSSVGSRDRFDFGLAGGLRLGLAVAHPVEPYLEVRVHRIFGPTVVDARGVERSTSETLVPIVLGVQY